MAREFFGKPGGKAAFSAVLMHVREQVGVSNWADFCAAAANESDIGIREGTIQRYAPSYQLASYPDPAVLYALHLWSKSRSKPFTFPNGEEITVTTLLEVLYGDRLSSGVLVDHRNGSLR